MKPRRGRAYPPPVSPSHPSPSGAHVARLAKDLGGVVGVVAQLVAREVDYDGALGPHVGVAVRPPDLSLPMIVGQQPPGVGRKLGQCPYSLSVRPPKTWGSGGSGLSRSHRAVLDRDAQFHRREGLDDDTALRLSGVKLECAVIQQTLYILYLMSGPFHSRVR